MGVADEGQFHTVDDRLRVIQQHASAGTREGATVSVDGTQLLP